MTEASPIVFEQAIIGSIIAHNAKFEDIASQCPPRLFVNDRNRNIYQFLYDAAQNSHKLTVDTLVAGIKNTEWRKEYFGSQEGSIGGYIEECVRVADGGMSWPLFSEQLKVNYARTKLSAAFDEAATEAATATSVEDISTKVVSKVVDASIEISELSGHGDCSTAALGEEFEDDYHREFDVMPFPQHPLNTMGGMQKGQIVILPAYTGMGKSFLCLDWMISFAKSGRKCWQYTLEMSWIQMWQRMLAMESGYELRDIVSKKLPWQSLRSFNDKLRQLPLHIQKSSNLTIDKLIADFIAAGDRRPDVIFIDHMHLMDFGADIRSMDMGLARLKTFAVEHDVAIVLLAQLSRPESRINIPKPSIYMLRNSGAIEQIADYIIFVHKHVEHDQDGREYHVMWTGKQRQGQPAQDFEVVFENLRFVPVQKPLWKPDETSNQAIDILKNTFNASEVV